MFLHFLPFATSRTWCVKLLLDETLSIDGTFLDRGYSVADFVVLSIPSLTESTKKYVL